MYVNFLGYELFARDVKTCAKEMADEAISGRRNCKVMACLNPHSYVVANDDKDFQSALAEADWLVPDGIGVIIAAQCLGLSLRRRVSGPDVFTALMKLLNQVQGSVFFLGSSDSTLEKICKKVATDYPGITISGTYSPPFKDKFTEEDNAKMIAAINDKHPDVLWVGMTAPKQEKWLAENRDKLMVGAAGAVGAAFDFFAGTVQRSPELLSRFGLEWLPRLIQQPRRLWRRTFVSAPLFLFCVCRARLSRGGR